MIITYTYYITCDLLKVHIQKNIIFKNVLWDTNQVEA